MNQVLALPGSQKERPAMSKEPALRTIDEILTLTDNGQYAPLLRAENEQLIREIVDFAASYGSKASGKITITINYTTDRFGQFELTAEHAIKPPKPPKAKGTAWPADEGGLTTANPNQKRMEIRDVAGKRELRTPD